MASRHVSTSESVTEGHPDKICDQVSDAVLDAILDNDPTGRVACETAASTGMLFITGEITTDAPYDAGKIARKTLERIGYTDASYGIDAETCAVITALHEQSPEIAQGVDGEATGAGDQGLMIGYACTETPELMPAPIHYAHKMAYSLSQTRREGTIPYLRPDGKTQITLAYDESGNPTEATAIVLAAQHEPDVDLETLEQDLIRHVVEPTIPDTLLTDDTHYYINHTGRFVRGGPFADAGLTGRKIIVDTYGGRAPHGGGAFSGKDPTKVDRSANYYARFVAKNIVAAGLAKECKVELAYSIAGHEPVGVHVQTRGTGVLSDERLAELASKTFDFSPQNMINELHLRDPDPDKRPRYEPLSAYGHMGRNDLAPSWETTPYADELAATTSDATPPTILEGT